MKKGTKVLLIWVFLFLNLSILALTCPNCNFENSDNSKFCGRCAYELQRKKKVIKKPSNKKPSTVSSLPAITAKNSAGVAAGLFFLLIVFLIVMKKRKQHKDYLHRINMQKTSLTMTTQLRMQNLKAGLDVDKGHPERRFERISVNIPVKYKQPFSEEPINSTVVDVSQGGLCFLVTSEIDIGSRVEVIFSDKDGNEINVAGEITACLPANKEFYRAGLKFYHLFKKQQDFIDSLIEK